MNYLNYNLALKEIETKSFTKFYSYVLTEERIGFEVGKTKYASGSEIKREIIFPLKNSKHKKIMCYKIVRFYECINGFNVEQSHKTIRKIVPLNKKENEIVEISFPRTEKDYKKREKLKRNFQTFNFYQSFKIKDLEILPIPVDHSILGATMYLIKGSKNVLYSGDFRLSELSEKEKERIFEIL